MGLYFSLSLRRSLAAVGPGWGQGLCGVPSPPGCCHSKDTPEAAQNTSYSAKCGQHGHSWMEGELESIVFNLDGYVPGWNEGSCH